MPFPWKLPTEEEADDLYRRIDQLITDLYNLIRSIIFGPPPLPTQQELEVTDDDIVPDLLAELGPPSTQNNSKDVDDPQPPMR